MAYQPHSPSSTHPTSKENTPPVSPLAQSKTNITLPHDNPKQKSELCRSFMETGFCPYFQRCKFAHGCHELLCNNQTNKKYKTK